MSIFMRGSALLNLLAVLYEDLEALAIQVYGVDTDVKEQGYSAVGLEADGMLGIKYEKLPRRFPARRLVASSGVTAAPSPIILPAKPSSGTFSMAVARPVMGLEMMVVETTFSSVGAAFSVAASVVDAVSVASATFSSSKVSGAVSR